uniref:Uncharacterized protein n=1 Tax=Populus trichocarpa TaxID=3694 RepID=A0A3N7FV26_POPTR
MPLQSLSRICPLNLLDNSIDSKLTPVFLTSTLRLSNNIKFSSHFTRREYHILNVLVWIETLPCQARFMLAQMVAPKSM